MVAIFMSLPKGVKNVVKNQANKQRYRYFNGGGGIKLDGKSILDLTHPVNSLFISKNNTSPAELFGGTWEEITANKTFWTIPTTDNTGGDIIDAGLPNIYGVVTYCLYGEPEQAYQVGALSVNSSGTSKKTNDAWGSNLTLILDASKYNNIYGNSETVQPPAIKVYAWVRVA